jgi:5,5'-dehydrodivanillate O-demethylase
MLTHEENILLTQVGRGTPGGELLRRYWHPVAAAAELTDDKPIRAVKILGEKLAVFRDRSGNYGLVGEHCPHRLASLAYGRVDEQGIRCPYHGWKFDGAGNCLEQPAEPADSTFKDRIKHVAYPVQYLGGLIYAYLGPAPAPLLPRWDVLVWEHGRRWIVKESVIECNWLQPMENSVDPSHLFWLHGSKSEVDEHPLLFPSVLRHVAPFKEANSVRHNLQIRVPVDDHHTQVFRANFVPLENERSPADAPVPYRFTPLKTAPREYRMDMVSAQDSMAWETQGSLTDRSTEHLGVGDEGIIELRKLLKEQIDRVQQGLDPLGVIRDPAQNQLIDLGVINERIGLYGQSPAPAARAAF